ncbi:MAG: hypothetical protein F4Z41_05100 [Acidimicrobiia bacterium]|nr:hypothetical protein [Acidimicrobiia bacterium]MXX45564.1 hypothetical protein [Acidimicrobiia bacterium]MXY75068.1 hypothetical protein [Acidimicrobiia bacterium]MYB78025.1 hypothetical protein [Acidimicrobiia bacterium]
MRRIDLQEHTTSQVPLRLSYAERRRLGEIVPSLSFDPAEMEGTYLLRPGSDVGAVEIEDLSILIHPKIGIPQLLSLACYAMGIVKHQDLRMFDFRRDEALPDVLARALSDAARQAFRKGLLHGYRTEEETLYGIKGRIRFDDQLRRRYAIAMPVEVRYDEFTNDILANQLVKAATLRLGRFQLRSEQARRGLGWVGGTLSGVSVAEFPPRRVPEVDFDRLNGHYRLVVELARLILRHSEFQSTRGEVRASGFLVNMDRLFEEFVTRALREALGVSNRTFRKVCARDNVTLDENHHVGLLPDLSWWDGGVCRFVGDAKYKPVSYRRIPNADLYQMLAYSTAFNLPGGMLIYAEGQADPIIHKVRHAGKRLEVAALDLSCPFEEIFTQVKDLANRIVALRNETRILRSAA